jgi:hypothetical protein
MTYYNEDPYIESEYEEMFNDWYEIEGIKKIKELSRQLRTFFKYKTEVIRYRFRSNLFPAKNCANTKFFSQKQKIESLTLKYITMLNNLKKNTQTLEQGIRSLFFGNNKIQLKNISEITEKLFMLLHYFSEESLHDHPKFLKFNVTLAKNICLVKKCLCAQFSEFFEELEINYNSLEGELNILLDKTPVEKEQSKKQLEERLTT